jgi:hypothetical protein
MFPLPKDQGNNFYKGIQSPGGGQNPSNCVRFTIRHLKLCVNIYKEGKENVLASRALRTEHTAIVSIRKPPYYYSLLQSCPSPITGNESIIQSDSAPVV